MADNAEQLFSEASALVDTMLENEIGNFVKFKLMHHVVDDIYNVYTPKSNGWVSGTVGDDGTPIRATYRRRHAISKQMLVKLLEPGKLLVTSTAHKSPSVGASKGYTAYPGDFLKLLEGTPGAPNNGMGLWQGGFPRPAVTNTQRDIDATLSPIIKANIKKYFA